MLFNKQNRQFFTRAAPAGHKVKTRGPRGTSSYAAAVHFAQLQCKVWFGGTGEGKDADL